jgi:LPPG:FO 2-phospho-L-lactate transferase
MITFLSGGTGTPKLIRGMRRFLCDEEISVVVNTAEDIWTGGSHLSPDIDTVMYLFSGDLNTDTWWGINGDTFVTHEQLIRLGVDEFIALGDRDRATNIARGELLRHGATLTEATKTLANALGVRASVLPMTDTDVTTLIRTGGRLIHFQEYWVKHRGTLPIDEVVREHAVPPVATPEVMEALSMSDAVIIGPSNPVTSILPILECKGVTRALEDAHVIAISPFIGDKPVSGPAAQLMEARGMKPDTVDTFLLYEKFTDIFIQDIRDTHPFDGALTLDTLMTGPEQSAALADQVLHLVRQ